MNRYRRLLNDLRSAGINPKSVIFIIFLMTDDLNYNIFKDTLVKIKLG